MQRLHVLLQAHQLAYCSWTPRCASTSCSLQLLCHEFPSPDTTLTHTLASLKSLLQCPPVHWSALGPSIQFTTSPLPEFLQPFFYCFLFPHFSCLPASLQNVNSVVAKSSLCLFTGSSQELTARYRLWDGPHIFLLLNE